MGTGLKSGSSSSSRDRRGGGLRLLLHRGGARRAQGALQIGGRRVLHLQPGGGRVLQETPVSAAFLFALAVSLCTAVSNGPLHNDVARRRSRGGHGGGVRAPPRTHPYDNGLARGVVRLAGAPCPGTLDSSTGKHHYRDRCHPSRLRRARTLRANHEPARASHPGKTPVPTATSEVLSAMVDVPI